ncbi:hypothetical protein JCM19992_03180 [Thermostilla marina]
MARIAVTLSGVERMLLNRLAEADAAVTLHTLRLTTEKKINSPSDDPAAFFTLSRFQTDLNVVAATMQNVTAASSLVTQTQSLLSQIRTQLETIQSELESPSSDSQEKIDEAIAQIDALATTEVDGRRVLDGSGTFYDSGRDTSQVADLRIYSVGGGGTVKKAQPAELTYTGSARYAAADASIKLTGVRGSTILTVSTDDTLEALAEKINARTASTGVQASVDDNTLTLSSTGTGSGAYVGVSVLSGTFAVTGGNGDGTANGTDGVTSSSPVIYGEVLQAATQAQLTHSEPTGSITADDTFTLSGTRGSTSISVTTGQTLSQVADTINAQSHTTGVEASVSGDGKTLYLTSIDYGANAYVKVTDGSFSVSGGDGNGTAYGTNAEAVINGRTYSDQGTDDQPAELRHREKGTTITNDAVIRITGALGSADITITAGQTLSDVASAIEAQKAVTGVTASVDSNDLVLQSTDTGDDASISLEVKSGTFTTVENYTEAAQAVITHTESTGYITAAAQFRLTGADGSYDFTLSGGESLSEVAQMIRAQSGTTGVTASVYGDQLLIQSTDTGSSAFVTFQLLSGTFDIEGDTGGTAYGTNATAQASGSDGTAGDTTIDGNRFIVNSGGFHFEIEFQPGFTGEFDPITVSGEAIPFALSTSLTRNFTLSIPSVLSTKLGGISGTLDQIAGGGAYSGLGSNTSRALRIVDEALADLTEIEGHVDGFYNAAVTSSSNLLSDIQSKLESAAEETDGYDEDEETTLLTKAQNLYDNGVAALQILNLQRSSIITMIQKIAGLI